MLDTDTSTINQLIDRVKEAEGSERNRARLESTAKPRLNVEIEDPIAWVRLFGYDPQRYFTDPAFYLGQYLRQKLWRFESIDDDVPLNSHVPAWLGHYPEYTFYGIEVGVHDHGGPELQTDHPMTRHPDLSLLEPVDFRTSGWMPRALRWYEDLVELSEGRLDIGFMAWNRGCLDLAVQLRGYEQLLLDTLERPEFVHELLSLLVRERNAWFSASCEYLGTELGPTWVADDWVAVPYISPGIFADFILPRYLEIEAHHGAIGGFHSCGDQAPLHEHMLSIESLASFEVSPWMDVHPAVDNLPEDKHLHIAVHPNDVVVDSPEEMERKHRDRAEQLAGTGHSFGLGTSGLTPLGNETDFLQRINTWLDLARNAFAN